MQEFYLYFKKRTRIFQTFLEDSKKKFDLNFEEESLSAVGLWVSHDPMVVTLSSPTG